MLTNQHRTKQLVALHCCLLAVALLIVGCSGDSGQLAEPATESAVRVIAVEQELAALEALAAPAGCDAASFKQLQAALRGMLLASGEHIVSAAPDLQSAGVDDFVMHASGPSAQCNWTYRNPGDYDQNSEVNISDLTPIGTYLGETAAGVNWLAASVADGDANGEITIGDITPIGQNYIKTVSGYYIEESTTGEVTGSWERVATVAFSSSTVPPGGGAREFTFLLSGAIEGRYYRVVPYHAGDTGYPGLPWQYGADPPATFSINGKCTDDYGEPLPGVIVTLSNQGSILSDAEGNFEFTEVVAGYSGTLTPLLDNLTFEPVELPIAVSSSDVVGQDFMWLGLPKYELFIDQQYLDELEVDVWANDYKPADVTVDGVEHLGVETRYRGSTARTFPKKSWKIRFNDLDEYEDPAWGYKRGTINLNAQYPDATLMREKLGYDLMQDLGILSPRARFVRVYINDEYMGLFTDVENPRKGWLKEFGYDNGGSMYQAQDAFMGELPTLADYEAAFEKQLREEEPYDDVAAFSSALNNWESAAVYAELNTVMDTQQLTRLMVAFSLISDSDNINTNYYLYYDEFGTGKWSIFPWDLDRTWGKMYNEDDGLFSLEIVSDQPLDWGSFDSAWAGGVWGNVLYHRFLADPQFWQEYTTLMSTQLDSYFTSESQDVRIDYAQLLTRGAALADDNKWGANADYDTRVAELKEYVQLRRGFLLDALTQPPPS